jgi:hypothetical protein
MGRKLGLDRVLDCFSLSLCANACACVHSVEEEEHEADERKALVSSQLEELVKLRDFVDGAAKTLAFHLEPKVSKQTCIRCYLFVPLRWAPVQSMLTSVHLATFA